MILVLGYPALAEYLRRDGFAVVTVATGEEALAQTNAEPPDLAIIDEAIPDADSYINKYKQLSPTTQAIVVSRNGNLSAERLQELLSGGHQAKAIAYYSRSKAPDMIREQAEVLVYQMKTAGWSLDGRTMILTHNGRSVKLTATEHDIMRYFMRYPDTWLEYPDLALAIYGEKMDRASAMARLKSSFYRMRHKVERLAGRTVFLDQQQKGLYFDSVGIQAG